MSIFSKIENKKIGWEELLDNNKNNIITERIKKILQEIFDPIEKMGGTCDILCMNAEDYGVMRKYLKDDKNFDEIHQRCILITGRFALYLNALVIVSSEASEPIGFWAETHLLPL